MASTKRKPPPVPRHFGAGREVKFWGTTRSVRPAVAAGHLGDGRTLLYVTPLATRPNWYLVRVDSSWGRWADGTDGHDHIDEVLDLLIDEFRAYESERGLLEEDGYTAEQIEGELWDRLYFPVVHLDCGFCWGVEARFDGRVWRKEVGS